MPHGHGAFPSGFPLVQAPVGVPHARGTQGCLKAGRSLRAVPAGGCSAHPLLYVSHSFKLKTF